MASVLQRHDAVVIAAPRLCVLLHRSRHLAAYTMASIESGYAIPRGLPSSGRPRSGWAELDWVGADVVRWSWLVLLEAAALCVFFCFDALPFQDLPAHAGLIALRDRLPDSPFEQRYWVLAPHLGGYSLFRALGHVLAKLGGAEVAVRIIAALPIVLMPASLIFARYRLYREVPASFGFAGTILSFGLMTAFGFASFLVALPLVIASLTLWLELMSAADRGSTTWRRELLVGALAVVILVTHGFAFMLFLGLCATVAVGTGRRWARLLCLRSLAFAVLLAASSALLEARTPVPSGSASWSGREPPVHFQGIADKLSLLLTPTLMTRSGIEVAVGIFLWGWAAMTYGHARRVAATSSTGAHTKGLGIATAALFGLFLVLPHSVGWFGFVDGRLLPLVLSLALLAAPWSSLPPYLRSAFERVVPVGATVMVAIALMASSAFQHEARGYRAVLAAVPSGTRLLNLPLEPDSRFFTAHPFIHYDKLALVDRPVVLSDVWFHQGSALYPTRDNPALGLPSSYSESNLRELAWPSYRLADWDYVLIRTDPASREPNVPPSLWRVRHEGGWWLYQVAIRG